MTTPEPLLSPIRSFFWPVYREETKLVLLLSAIFFIIVGSNVLIWPFHTSLLVNAPNSGVEVMGYVRILGNVPGAILYILFYNWMSIHFSKPTIILINYSIFTGIYLLYGFFIIPNHTSFIVNPDTISEYMTAYPRIKWLFPALGNWPSSILFVITEVWTGACFSQFFWQTANNFTKTSQAARLYPIFIIAAGLSGVVAIPFLKAIIGFTNNFQYSTPAEGFNIVIQVTSVLMIFFTLLLYILFRLQYKLQAPPNISTLSLEKSALSPSPLNGLRSLFKSRYLLFIFLTLFFSQNIYQIINFIWKSELQLADPQITAYDYFLTSYELWNAVGFLVLALITRHFISYFGWLTSAFLTPIISLLAALPFFVLFYFFAYNGTELFNLNSHYLLSILGASQSIIMGASLSCLYYPTKEMTYIPLPKHIQVEGKAAADILGGTGGLAVGSLIQEGLLAWSEGTDISIVPQLTWLIALFFAIWFFATGKLAKKYTALMEELRKKPDISLETSKG